MLDKKDIINFLFVISFPIYGIGSFVSGNVSPVLGYLVSISMHFLIILFYVIDLLYKKEFKLRINASFFFMILYLASSAGSLLVSLSRQTLHPNPVLMYAKMILVTLPFFAFIAVCLYNDNRPDQLVKLTFRSLSVLLFINLIGFFGLGLDNATHSIEGRINFPFLDGLYSGACMLAVLNLMVLYFLQRSLDNPLKVTYLLAYFAVNLVLLFFINSRLTILVFILVFLLFAFNVSRSFRGLFLGSLLTLPILLNGGLLLYRILSLPVFVFIMQRVNLIDVTTFNGRALVWQRAIDWLFYDQRGVIFGNGANGHYYLHLIPDIAKMWGVPEQYSHLHSTVLMVVVDQGIVGYLLLIGLFYRMYIYYRKKFQMGSKDGVFFSVVVFMLIVMQVDTFVLLENLGFVIFNLLIAKTALNETNPSMAQADIQKQASFLGGDNFKN
jgi:O-antigen ligase